MTDSTKVRSLALLMSTVVIAVGSLTACDINVSDDAKDKGKGVICASAENTIRDLDSGDEAAKLAAVLVRDNTDNEEIKKAAKHVAEGKGTKKERKQIIKWIRSECG